MFKIERLTSPNALLIAQWHYQGEYEFYDMTADPEDYQELLSEESRGDSYYQVIQAGKLVGFFAVEDTNDEEAIEIGLGMAPELIGKGKGFAFATAILNYVIQLKNPQKVLFDVAEFNVRARKLYQKLGFKVVNHHNQETNGGVYPFILMAKFTGK
ncbi:GNAT family N-acetyltransferase [Liquorilactobacillus mali]|uniref:Ribosomal-protein-alanine acetyltransferase n=1 Tax=Liquorilactobacillus mali TaxID=1618 RepID=A0A0R2FXI7_9LACO|nr:GNAT family N-acetyltransferase [Liquorilactobacillus mali]KRN29994.1 ribosomal-protein-alanine acetyltransferase [Liquorilactobacillus mali]MDN7144782.1 GNAT family N-acetyltransferase [Liquorilactobacillus mali]